MSISRSSHKHIGQDTLSEYLDGRLLGRPFERVEQQVAECDACRQDLAELRALVAMMQQLTMAEPRRSFVMSAPPPEPVRARPALALRAPNWVYAGAASVAALALAVTISVDATGGLTSDALRQESVATSATAPVVQPEAASEGVAAATGPVSGRGPAGQPGIESAARATDSTGDTSVANEEAAAPTSLAAAAAPPPTELLVQEDSAGAQAAVSSVGADATAVPVATSAPVVKMTTPSQDEEASAAESAAPPVAVPAPEADSAGEDGVSRLGSETGPAGPSGPPSQPGQGPREPAVPDLFTDIKGGGTSTWWRLLEVASGALAVVFLAVFVFRWRAGRRDLP